MKNQELDKVILESLAGRSMRFNEICGLVMYEAAERQVDRRLQALRKKGAIAFKSKTGWSVK